jgi:DNA-binding NarL/FixJ family response regulator
LANLKRNALRAAQKKARVRPYVSGKIVFAFSRVTTYKLCALKLKFSNLPDFRKVKKGTVAGAIFALCRVLVVGDNCVAEEGTAAIIARDKRYRVCAGAYNFDDAGKLIRKHRPDVLLIEPFLEGRDGIQWIKEIATEFPRIRILVVSRQPERIYAERALRAGAVGYWMKTGSPEDLLRAVETVAGGAIYVSPAITALAVERFGYRKQLPHVLDVLTDRELAVFSLIGGKYGVGQIAAALGISRKTVESHCEHIKARLGYADCSALKRGARELLGTSVSS